MQVVTKKAYAKVNLSLDIVGRREDGYHLVRMVMQTLDIADYLTFEKIEVPEDALDKTKGQETEDPRIVTLLADKRYDGSDKSSAGTSELGTLPLGSDNLIYRVAQMLLEKYDGKVPSDIDKLTKLPGVGRKTGNVIRGNIYGIESVVVDTHVKRLSNLIGLTDEDDPVKIEMDLMKKIPKDHWILINKQLMAHGRAVCIARRPKCDECTLSKVCKYAKNISNKK